MQVKIKKLLPEATIPKYAKPGDAGLDMTATSIRKTADYWEYGTGLAIEIPRGYVGLGFARSSISDRPHSLANAVAVIDSGYRGEIKFRMRVKKYKDNLDYVVPDGNAYQVGEKVGQLLILPYPEIELVESDTLSESERGTGGYGSTGKT